MTTLRITQIRSGIGGTKSQRATLRTLGLRKINASTERPDTPVVRGMIKTVTHLVAVEEVDAQP
jgi:large subunit ribosomal protein L30